MAFIWAIDYYTHDIVWHMLTQSENNLAYLSLFRRIKSANYQLKYVVCDEHPSILYAAITIFPKAKIQICTTHYKRNIQKQLNLRNDSTDIQFFTEIITVLNTKNLRKFNGMMKDLLLSYQQNKYRSIFLDINNKINLLTTHLLCRKCPATTNLIEGYNKHLAGRLKTMDGFKSYETATLWLNAYVINRRLRKFTHCTGIFKHLNGTFSLQHTLKNDAPGIYLLRDLF